jgi:TRAP-type mannitol/chloroaromatic compound transport system permease small subunit
MRWIRALVKGIDGFSTITANTIRWLVLIIMSITVYDVVLRYFFNDPTIWAYELSGLLLGPFWLLGGAYVLLHDGHVRLDILYRRFSPRKQAIIDLVTFTLLFFYCGLILIHGWDYFLFSFSRFEHSLTMWGPPIWPFKLVIVIGAALILLQGIAKYIRDLYMGITGRRLE